MCCSVHVCVCVWLRVPQWCNDSPREQDPWLRLPPDSPPPPRQPRGGTEEGRGMVVKKKTTVATAVGSSGQ